jgi:hypothetical protein
MKSKVFGCTKPNEKGVLLYRFYILLESEKDTKCDIFICSEDKDEFISKVESFLENFDKGLRNFQNQTRISKKNSQRIFSGDVDNMEKLPKAVYVQICRLISATNKRNLKQPAMA